MKLHHFMWAGSKRLGGALATLALWTLWLGLSLLLALQVYIASVNQLEVPAFVLKALEARLTMSGMQATFGRTLCDPTGHVLIENVAIKLPGFEEPLVTARAIYARLDPWALAAGRFDPAELQVIGASLRVPAMLSPSGTADEVVRDLDGSFSPRSGEIGIGYLNFRLGNVDVAAHGALHLAAAPKGANGPLPIAEFLARNYAGISREFADAVEAVGVLEQPILRVELTPSESRGAIAHVTLIADGLKLASPLDLRTGAFRLKGRFPFALRNGEPLEAGLEFVADRLDLPLGVTAHGVRARVQVKLPPGRLRFDRGVFQGIEFSAADIEGAGVTVEDPLVSLTAGPLPKLRAGIRASIADAPLSLESDIDLQARTARVQFDGSLPPGLLGPLGARLGRDLKKHLSLTSPVEVAGEATFGAGWKFQRVTARVALRAATVARVRIDEARGRIEFDGRRLVAPEVYARIGRSFAGGYYEQDVATHDYRILVDGSLLPSDIGAWFPAGDWWHTLFADFAFPAGPPAAKVDVRGCWTNGRKSAVFVAVDSAGPQFRGVALDRIRSRLFIRPNFDDGLDFQVTRGAHAASGTFARRYDLDAGALQSVEVNLTSTFDLASAVKIAGPQAAAILAPFAFERAPTVTATGHFDGPAAPGGAHKKLHLQARSDGTFSFHNFPFQGVAFTLELDDDDITIDPIAATFAGGAATGRAKVWGRGAGQKLKFHADLKGASLGQAVASLETFAAKKSAPGAPSALANFVKEKSDVKLGLSFSGEGFCDDFLSYQGNGRALIEGADLGELRLLGLLSELFPVTSLHFTSVRADFKIDGPQLVFSDVSEIGANSAIRGHGTYAMDKHQLDFKAKIYPFLKSKSLPQQLMSGVLAPLSEFFEVKLIGSIEKPKWEFEHGPTNFFHSLTPPNPNPLKSATPAPSSSSHPAT